MLPNHECPQAKRLIHHMVSVVQKTLKLPTPQHAYVFLQPKWPEFAPSSLGPYQGLLSVVSNKVVKLNTVNDQYWCTRLGVARLLCGPIMDNCISGGGLKRMELIGGLQWLAG